MKKRQDLLLRVDGTRTLDERMRAANLFPWDRQLTAENFPPTGNETVEMRASLFTRNPRGGPNIEEHVVLELFARLGMKPAGIWELLAVAEQYPDIQTVSSVMALETSYIDGEPYIATIACQSWTRPPKRCLYLPHHPPAEDYAGDATVQYLAVPI